MFILIKKYFMLQNFTLLKNILYLQQIVTIFFIFDILFKQWFAMITFFFLTIWTFRLKNFKFSSTIWNWLKFCQKFYWNIKIFNVKIFIKKLFNKIFFLINYKFLILDTKYQSKNLNEYKLLYKLKK